MDMNKLEIQPALGIGQDALRANGVEGVSVLDTVFPGEEPGQVYPEKEGDTYLIQMGARVADSGGAVMVMKMLPGEKQYLRSIGLLPFDTQVIEVTPQVGTSKQVINGEIVGAETKVDKIVLGYPFTHPTGLLKGKVQIEQTDGQPLHYVSTFSGPKIAEMADNLGMTALERPHSDITNNKAHLRAHAEKYGITMLPGAMLDTEEDLETVLQNYEGKTMWLKYPTGSGGDLVHRIQGLTRENLIETIVKLRGEVVKAFEDDVFEVDGNQYWPVTKLHPDGFPLVIEEDAGEEGEIIINGSNSFTTNNDGSVVIHGFFEQLTSDDGEYLGSKPMTENGLIQELIIEQTMKLAQYNMEENGYFGNQGADYFVLRRKDGTLAVKVVELNTRPPVSMYAHVVANRLGFESFINMNVVLDREVKTMEDYFDAVGKQLAYGEETEEGKVQVVLLASRTLFSRTQERGEEIFASPHCKVVVLGESPQQCVKVVQRLKERGVLPKAA